MVFKSLATGYFTEPWQALVSTPGLPLPLVSIIMPPPLIGGALSDAFVWRLSVAYMSRTERHWHRGSPRHTWLGHHFQCQGHEAALLTAALTREAGAAVTVRTYWAWETTATLRLLGGARGTGPPTGEERGEGISCRHAHSLFIHAMVASHVVHT